MSFEGLLQYICALFFFLPYLGWFFKKTVFITAQKYFIYVCQNDKNEKLSGKTFTFTVVAHSKAHEEVSKCLFFERAYFEACI